MTNGYVIRPGHTSFRSESSSAHYDDRLDVDSENIPTKANDSLIRGDQKYSRIIISPPLLSKG